MKSFKYIIVILLVGITLTSCHTALIIPPIPPLSAKRYQKANMEFIGFRNANRSKTLFKNFGAELEQRNIALNQQNFYMGVYSFQELETYKSNMRYVAFVDISSFHDNWNDCVYDRADLDYAAWLVAGISCFTLFPVYIPMFCAANKNYCQLEVLCQGTVNIYDTRKDKIILSIPIDFQDTQILKGQYSHKETDREALKKRSQTLLYNELLKHFDQAYNFIEKKK